jgi:ABC-2 type transport system ATP-binding protein
MALEADPRAEAAPTAAGRPGLDQPVLRVEGLGKDFRHPWTGRIKTAVDAISFEVPPGTVFGLLGPNGAGKTTTLKLILGLLPASRGQAWILGRPAHEPASRVDIGYLPENPYFYDHLTAEEFLEYSGELAGLTRAAARRQGAELLERVGLGEVARQRLRKYSKGMLQRAGLAHALLGKPRLLFLDEPMSGLDPIGRREVVDLIHELRQDGTTVVFSSHILHDVETLCDRVVILKAGRLLAEGSLESLLEKEGTGAEILVRASGTLILPMEFLGVSLSAAGSLVRLTVDAVERVTPLLAWLAAHGHQIVSVTPERNTLEDLFVNLFQDAHDVGGDPERGRGRQVRA